LLTEHPTLSPIHNSSKVSSSRGIAITVRGSGLAGARDKTNTVGAVVIQEPAAGRLIIHALSHLNYTAERRRVVNWCAAVKIAQGLLIAADLIYNMQYELSHLEYTVAFE
jgi:hypothetical protein